MKEIIKAELVVFKKKVSIKDPIHH